MSEETKIPISKELEERIVDLLMELVLTLPDMEPDWMSDEYFHGVTFRKSLAILQELRPNEKISIRLSRLRAEPLAELLS